MNPEKDFMFGQGVAGCFTTPDWPQADGRYTYEPYRSVFHYDMHEAIKNTGGAKCFCDLGEQTIWFSVIACPGYGVLELRDFVICGKDRSET